MTRRDYVKIAAVINGQLRAADYDRADYWALLRLMDALALTLKEDNSAFDRNRWESACITGIPMVEEQENA